VHDVLIEAARRITVPVQFLLPWDDEHVDRRSALALFDAFASKEKTLHANPGDHRNIAGLASQPNGPSLACFCSRAPGSCSGGHRRIPSRQVHAGVVRPLRLLGQDH